MRDIATYRINCAFDTEIDEALKACETPEEALMGLIFRLRCCPATRYERWWLEQLKTVYEYRVAERMLNSFKQ